MRNPDVNVVLFTGSYDVGRRIQQLSADFSDRIVAAEMGSKSAVIVCEDAKLDLAVNAAILSAFKTSGQRCVSAGPNPGFRAGFRRVRQAVRRTPPKRLRVGDPLDPTQLYRPGHQRNRGGKGANSTTSWPRTKGPRSWSSGGQADRMRLTRTATTSRRSSIGWSTAGRCGAIREEVFGPHVALIPFKTNEDAVRIYNDTDYGLSLAVITESYRTMRLFREECDFGMGYVNLPCIGAEVHLPFGGVKKSGNGHPSAAGLADVVTHKVAWTVNHGTEIKMAQGLSADVSVTRPIHREFQP